MEQNLQPLLRDIWAKVLALEPEEVGANDNLFDLGGDSVKAILIMAKAAEKELFFDIQTLYDNPTTGSLAKALGRASFIATSTGHAQNGSPSLNDGDCNGGDLLKRVRQRMGSLGIPEDSVIRVAKMREDQVDFVDMTSRGAIGASPVFIYQISGLAVREKLQQAVTRMTARHPMLRTTFIDMQEGNWYQVLLAEAQPKLHEREGSIAEYAHEAGTRIIAPGGTTAWYELVDDKESKDGPALYFVFSILHAFFDSYSRTLIEEELLAALKNPADVVSQQQQQQPPWYGDFARRLENELDAADAETFWHDYLAGSPMETVHTGPAGPAQRHDRSLHTSLPTETRPALPHIQLATAITAAWGLALIQVSGLRDVAFTTLTLGRLYPCDGGLDRQVGLLVKDRPLRLRLQGNDTGSSNDSTSDQQLANTRIGSLLQGVQADLLSAARAEHNDRRFGRPGQAPQLQTYLNIKLGGSAMQATEVDGLKLTPRRDLEHWESETRYAVYLEVKPLGDAHRFEMRFHSSLVDEPAASALFGSFMALLQRMTVVPGCSSDQVVTSDTTVAELLASSSAT